MEVLLINKVIVVFDEFNSMICIFDGQNIVGSEVMVFKFELRVYKVVEVLYIMVENMIVEGGELNMFICLICFDGDVLI